MADQNFSTVLLIVDTSRHVQVLDAQLKRQLNALLAFLEKLDRFILIDVVYCGPTFYRASEWGNPGDIAIHVAPSGPSRLFDGIAFATYQLKQRIDRLPEHARPGKVSVFVATGGADDLSQEFDPELLNAMFNHFSKTYGWSFEFIGASREELLMNVRSAVTSSKPTGQSGEGRSALLRS
jgi:hypothetical protein